MNVKARLKWEQHNFHSIPRSRKYHANEIIIIVLPSHFTYFYYQALFRYSSHMYCFHCNQRISSFRDKSSLRIFISIEGRSKLRGCRHLQWRRFSIHGAEWFSHEKTIRKRNGRMKSQLNERIAYDKRLARQTACRWGQKARENDGRRLEISAKRMRGN